MITFLIIVIWFFVVLPYIFRRMMPRAVAISRAIRESCERQATPEIETSHSLKRGDDAM
jgi:hypothetical protein